MDNKSSVAAINSTIAPAKLNPGEIYRFHVMVKPCGSQCNLDCTYCFYLHKEDLLKQPKMPRMDKSTLEAHIQQYIEGQTGDEVIFSWQGGEPTLMGIDFFQQIIELQCKYKKPNQRIENDLQTNGTLLDDNWCMFLKQNNFLVGLSIDGPEQLHNLYRYNKGGKPTFKQIMRCVTLLHKHEVPFSAMCVVNRTNARKPIDVYRFFRDEIKPRMIQFTPAVAPSNFNLVSPEHWEWDKLPILNSPRTNPANEDSVVTDWSILASDWGYFLNRIWDEWFKRDYGKVFIDQFENVISQIFGYGAQKCISSEFCGKALAVEHNGDLFSCDHFVYPEYKLGNITKQHEANLVFSEQQTKFAYAKYTSLPMYCKQCKHLKLCWGECPKNRFIKAPNGEKGLNYLCSGLREFYSHVLLDYATLANRLNIQK